MGRTFRAARRRHQKQRAQGASHHQTVVEHCDISLGHDCCRDVNTSHHVVRLSWLPVDSSQSFHGHGCGEVRSFMLCYVMFLLCV